MAEVVAVSTSQLLPSDLRALVTYLRSVPASRNDEPAPIRRAPASESPREPSVASNALGEKLFAGACASCHGWSGVSPLSAFATLTATRAVNDPHAINAAQIVISGSGPRVEGGALAMPAFGASYSDTEIAALVNYVTGRFGATPSQLRPAEIAKLRQATSD